MPESKVDLVIVGAGPGGLSAAAHAGQQGMSHVLLEAGGAHANTIQQYQLHKHVMAEPSVLPLRSDMEFAAGRRETILESWERGIREANVNIRYRSEVTGIRGTRGDFVDYHHATRVEGLPNWTIDVLDGGAFPHFESFPELVDLYDRFCAGGQYREAVRTAVPQ